MPALKETLGDKAFEELEGMIRDKFRKVDERFERMKFDRMLERMTSLTRWSVGTIALFGSIISILLAIGQFIK